MRNLILLISIVCISSLSACAQTIESKQAPSTANLSSSQTTMDPQTSQVSAPQEQPANLPAPAPKNAPELPESQQMTPPANQPAVIEETTEQHKRQPLRPRITQSPVPVYQPELGPSAGAPSGAVSQPGLAPAAISRGAVSLNFDDADIYSVIQTVFSEILKFSYVIDPRVKGRVTFRSIAPVPRDNVLPLMEVILRLNGVAIVEENNLYRIIPISDVAREPSPINIGRSPDSIRVKGKALLQVVPIQYLQSTELIKLLSPFTSTSAVVIDVPKTNHIIIVDTDTSVKRILELINFFDSEQQKKKGPQVFVYHVQNGKAKDIGALLQQIFLGTAAKQADKGAPKTTGQAASTPPPTSASPAQTKAGGTEGILSDVARIFSDDILNAIIVLSTPEDYNIIKETIVKLDIVPRQVLIEGAIAQVQLTDNMSLGIAWHIKNSNRPDIYLNPNALQTDLTKQSGLNLVGIDASGSVTAFINALASQSKAKLLASPHIMVSDNREAKIQVGQQVPIATSETYGTPGVAPQQTIQYKDIGIILKVKPQINDSGLVAMDISQEVSTFITQPIGTEGTQQVVINKTEATTNLVVQNGQTIVIGGLIREDDTKNRQGIPFLSKIPVLGYLFGNTDKENSRTELVILLTPRVIKNQQEAASITSKYIDSMSDEKMSKEVKGGVQTKTLEKKDRQ